MITALALTVIVSLPLSLPARPAFAGTGPPPEPPPEPSVQILTGTIYDPQQQYLATPTFTTPNTVTVTRVTTPGLPLYTFSKDVPYSGTSACSTGICATLWPAATLLQGATIIPPPGLPGTLDVIARPDGLLQLTYNGWPLYWYVLDCRGACTGSPGMFGNGQNALGGTWTLATP
jgi:predicted lipoprotein with Yx(FWY)xxD motif